ncbi:MAG: CDP-alcohol phosphatidyltransferase family protein [Spirochaetales bacterium]|nr:CDP-alcohol phosphatidyltransferase family protein [Spirochaetales bacterium]
MFFIHVKKEPVAYGFAKIMYKAGDLKKIPNLLSLSRFLCAPLVFYFFSLAGWTGKILTLGFLTLLFLTDFFDGYLARKLNQESDLGRILDPLADKLLILLLLVALIIYRDLPLYVLFIVLGRDLAILIGGLYITLAKKIVLESNIWGKAATVCMMAAVLIYVLDIWWYISLASLILGLLLIFISFITYLRTFLKTLRTKKTA